MGPASAWLRTPVWETRLPAASHSPAFALHLFSDLWRRQHRQRALFCTLRPHAPWLSTRLQPLPRASPRWGPPSPAELAPAPWSWWAHVPPECLHHHREPLTWDFDFTEPEPVCLRAGSASQTKLRTGLQLPCVLATPMYLFGGQGSARTGTAPWSFRVVYRSFSSVRGHKHGSTPQDCTGTSLWGRRRDGFPFLGLAMARMLLALSSCVHVVEQLLGQALARGSSLPAPHLLTAAEIP